MPDSYSNISSHNILKTQHAACLLYDRCLLCSWPQPIKTNGVHLSHISSGTKWGRRPRTFSITGWQFRHTHTHDKHTNKKRPHTFAYTCTLGEQRRRDARDERFWVVTATGQPPTVNQIFTMALPAALFITQHSPRSAAQGSSFKLTTSTGTTKTKLSFLCASSWVWRYDIYIAFPSTLWPLCFKSAEQKLFQKISLRDL